MATLLIIADGEPEHHPSATGVWRMANIRGVLNALSDNDRRLFTICRNHVRKAYLVAQRQIGATENWDINDDLFLDTIDNFLVDLFKRHGRQIPDVAELYRQVHTTDEPEPEEPEQRSRTITRGLERVLGGDAERTIGDEYDQRIGER